MDALHTLAARDAIDVSGPQLLRDAKAFEAIVYVQLGVIAWDWLTTLNFDVALFTGRKPFTWPTILYLGARYGSWAVSIALLFQVNAWEGINCNTVWIFVVIGVKMQKLFGEAVRSACVCRLGSQPHHHCHSRTWRMLQRCHWLFGHSGGQVCLRSRRHARHTRQLRARQVAVGVGRRLRLDANL